MILTWRKGDPEGVAEAARRFPGQFSIMDPGADGVVCIFDHRGSPRATVPVRGYEGCVAAAWMAAVSESAHALVVEEPFVKMGIQSAMKTVRYASYMAGAFASMMDRVGAPWLIVNVPAASWYSAVIGGAGKRAERKKKAMDYAALTLDGTEPWDSATKALRGAMADAYCMAEWWRGLSH